MFTKRTSFMLSLILILSMALGACTTNVETQVPKPDVPDQEVAKPAVTEPEVTEPKTDEVVTIRFQDWRLAEEPANSALQIILSEFEKAHPNIKVQQEPVAQGERVEKYNNQLRAGDPPDVVRFNVTELQTEIAMGAYEPLDRFLEAEGGVDSFFEDFAPFLINPTKKDGSVYAIPHEGDTFLLYVNKRLWEEAGLDPVNNPPKTFEELKQANFQLTDKSKNQYAFSLYPAVAWLQSWFNANGARYFNEDYTETYIDSPEGIEAFKFFVEMYSVDGVVPPGAPEVSYGDQVALMAQEQVAYIQGPYATWGGILAANPALTEDLIAIPFPGTGATAGRGTHFSIGAGSEHPEEAWELIKWLTSADQMMTFFEVGSMLPTRISALDSIDFEKYPAAKVMVQDSIPYAIESYPSFPEWGKASSIFSDGLIAALLNEDTPENILKDVAAEIREILASRQ